ncbi:unnamed protein product [Rhodiola kirilowii]
MFRQNAERIASPPLTPISFACMMPVSTTYGVASPPSQIRDYSLHSDVHVPFLYTIILLAKKCRLLFLITTGSSCLPRCDGMLLMDPIVCLPPCKYRMASRQLHICIITPLTPSLPLPSTYSPFDMLRTPLLTPLASSPPSQTHRISAAAEDTSATKMVNECTDYCSLICVIWTNIIIFQKRASAISDVLKGTSIFLVGMKSNIKTSMGKILAEALRYYYFDSDELVEDAAGVGAGGRSFRDKDEEGFRSSETEVLRQLSSMGRLVVSAGDGAVQSATNLSLLRHGISVCLDLPLEIVANNVMESLGEGSASEMDRDQVISQLIVQYNENKSGYANSDVTVSLQKVALELGYEDIELVTKDDLALAVIKEIEKLTRVKKLLEEAARPF